jgi:uncharacterized protein
VASFPLGLISDTHGLLRPEAVRALEGSRAILHAGDVGDPAILDALAGIAPLFAVRGNVDTGSWAGSLPLGLEVQPAGVPIYVLHNLSELDLEPASAGFRMVVSGHTHKPGSHWRGQILYVNPGSAGPRRFDLPVCLARVDLLRTPWKVEFIELCPS